MFMKSFLRLFTVLQLVILMYCPFLSADRPEVLIGRVKYSGGGDWYNDPSAEVNLIKFLASNTNIKAQPRYAVADLSTDDIFSFPVLFLTGHGNITLSESEVKRLRTYLERGGFLYVDDDYGLDKAFRREMKKVFPENELVELPFSHKIYHSFYEFPAGPPKTHEHDKKPAQGFGIYVNNRLAVYYTFESNPSDGWVDKEVYNDPEAKRIEALKFGVNIIIYALTRMQ